MRSQRSLCSCEEGENRANPVSFYSSSFSKSFIFRVPCRALIEVFQENRIMSGQPKTGSLFFWSQSLVLGSPGYPLPNSPLNSKSAETNTYVLSEFPVFQDSVPRNLGTYTSCTHDLMVSVCFGLHSDVFDYICIVFQPISQIFCIVLRISHCISINVRNFETLLQGISSQLQSRAMTHLVQIHVIVLVVHRSRYVLGSQIFCGIKYDLASQDVDGLKEMLSLIFSQSFTVVKSQGAQLFLELDGPPEGRVDHGAEDGSSPCLVDSQLEIRSLDILWSVLIFDRLPQGFCLFAGFAHYYIETNQNTSLVLIFTYDLLISLYQVLQIYISLFTVTPLLAGQTSRRLAVEVQFV